MELSVAKLLIFGLQPIDKWSGRTGCLPTQTLPLFILMDSSLCLPVEGSDVMNSVAKEKQAGCIIWSSSEPQQTARKSWPRIVFKKGNYFEWPDCFLNIVFCPMRGDGKTSEVSLLFGVVGKLWSMNPVLSSVKGHIIILNWRCTTL